MNDDASKKKYILISVIILIGIIFLSRLFYIQIVDDRYVLSAESISRRHQVIVPERGLIFDRNNELLVYNEISYDLIVNTKRTKEFDTLKLCGILGIEKTDLRERLLQIKKKQKGHFLNSRTVIEAQISIKQAARIYEIIYKFPGFDIEKGALRKYSKDIAGHVLGYVGMASKELLQSDSYYSSRDNVGIGGIELSYENLLRGKKGINIRLVDVRNRIQGKYKDGKYDSTAVVGKSITTTLDAGLQEYCEQLMKNKTGSVVAIEPATGEILAMVSAPSYDPNFMIGKKRSKYYSTLQKDKEKPLLNRAINSAYPPGSTFKMLNALICLQEGIINRKTTFPCYGGYHIGNFSQACHHGGEVSLINSIVTSCNAYYSNAFRRLLDNGRKKNVKDNYNMWRDAALSFGLGQRLGTDAGYESSGIIREGEYFDKRYGENKWKSLWVVSLAIGQGELGITPLQLANMTAAIANRGYYFTPHVIKSVSDSSQIDSAYKVPHQTGIDKDYFNPVIEGMAGVALTGGTAPIAAINGVELCGKTGTAENPHGDDHSIFIAFAPRNNPKIALAVYVENAGFGSTYAAPIASLAVEKYLNDTIARSNLEARILATDLIHKDEETSTNQKK